MPDVRDPGFAAKAADEIVQLLEHSQGRAFCLFTSYAQMNDLYEPGRSRGSLPEPRKGHARTYPFVQIVHPRITCEQAKTPAPALLQQLDDFINGLFRKPTVN